MQLEAVAQAGENREETGVLCLMQEATGGQKMFVCGCRIRCHCPRLVQLAPSGDVSMRLMGKKPER
jgi:hypothetical protein